MCGASRWWRRSPLLIVRSTQRPHVSAHLHPDCAASHKRAKLLKPRQNVFGPTELLGSVAGPRYHIKQRGPSGAVLLSGAPDLTLEVRPSPSAFGKLQDLQAVSGRRSYGHQAIAADWRASRGERLS